jgi:DNA-binding YbaB/EbfC family protein
MINTKIKKVFEEAQRMKDQFQRDLSEMRVSATAGGGAVTAMVNGQKDLLELSIDPDTVDPSDVEMLQDLVVAAINEASRRVDEEVQEKLGGIMGGMGLPGMMG